MPSINKGPKEPPKYHKSCFIKKDKKDGNPLDYSYSQGREYKGRFVKNNNPRHNVTHNRPSVSNDDFDSILQMAEAFVEGNEQPGNVFAQNPLLWMEADNMLGNIFNRRNRRNRRRPR